MNQKIRLVGLTLGNPFDPASRSGVNYNVFSRLSELCELVKVFDLDIKGARKIFSAAKHFSFNRARWGNKLHQNPLAFNMRTQEAGKKLISLKEKFDLIFQDSAMFMPGFNIKAPFVSYHDSNVLLSARGGPYSQGAHYSGKKLIRTIEQEKLVYKKASLIFSMSEWLKNSLIADFGISEEKIITVYAGTNLKIVDFKKFYDGKTILFVGKNFERKGGKTLLEAFMLVKKEIKDARLFIVGPKINIDTQGVTVLGPVYNKDVLAKYFREASLFVLPSVYEPFGIVFAEAFVYKNPCIGTTVCAMPEIIEEGKGGFLIPPNDYKKLANRIIELLKDEALSIKMGAYGFKKIKDTLNWDVVVQKMMTQCTKLFDS
jgi:glycosyltransferase involved in cell wall biosynthesis